LKEIEKYRTLAKGGQGLYKEKGSKFIGLSYHVRSKEEVKQKLVELKSEYHDARHHCYAYILGDDGSDVRANDDGEPGHSAGDPILGQINSLDLTYTLVVVIRYFGGTKLGVSGLINAYKTSASEALNHSKIIKVDITQTIKMTYAYDATSEVMKLIDDFTIEIIEQTFEENCQLTGEIKIGMLNQFKTRVQLLVDTGSELKIDDS